MIFACDYRASGVLYNFLKSNFKDTPQSWLLPANICDCVPETFEAAGVKYEFVDISHETWCMDWSQVIDKIEKYAGLMYVHTYGVEDTPYVFFSELKKRNPQLCLIDDRCLCTPKFAFNAEAIENGVDLELYSLGAKKQIPYGGGGYSLIKNNNYSFCKEDETFLMGVKSILNEDLIRDMMFQIGEHKERLNAVYRSLLPKDIQLPEAYQHWRFNILVPNKEEIMQAIFDAGLFASGHYAPQAENCAIASNLYNHVINLFNDFYYTEEQAIRTCKIINDKLKNGI